jgi:hypothetical protein
MGVQRVRGGGGESAREIPSGIQGLTAETSIWNADGRHIEGLFRGFLSGSAVNLKVVKSEVSVPQQSTSSVRRSDLAPQCALFPVGVFKSDPSEPKGLIEWLGGVDGFDQNERRGESNERYQLALTQTHVGHSRGAESLLWLPPVVQEAFVPIGV